MLLQKAIDLFLGEYKPSTRKTYKYVLLPMAAFIGPGRELAEIRAEYLVEYMQRLKKTTTSPATYNKHVKSIRTFFNWCLRLKLIADTPATAIKRQRRSKAIPKEKAMPEAVYLRLLEYAQFDERYHALVLFLGDTGCRIGGAAGLRWLHIDFEQLRATVTEKGEKTRPVFFGPDCSAALRRWRLACTLRDGDFVFSKHGGRIKAANLAQVFRRMGQNAGLGSWGPHSLRHRKGHQLADSKTAPSIAAQALGHENVLTTLEFYYPEDWERVQEAMEKLAHNPEHIRPVKVRQFRR